MTLLQGAAGPCHCLFLGLSVWPAPEPTVRLGCITHLCLKDAEAGLSQRQYIETSPEQARRASSQPRLATVRAGLSPRLELHGAKPASPACWNHVANSRRVWPGLGPWSGKDEKSAPLDWFRSSLDTYQLDSRPAMRVSLSPISQANKHS